jgi:hypothetical protein
LRPYPLPGFTRPGLFRAAGEVTRPSARGTRPGGSRKNHGGDDLVSPPRQTPPIRDSTSHTTRPASMPAAAGMKPPGPPQQNAGQRQPSWLVPGPSQSLAAAGGRTWLTRCVSQRNWLDWVRLLRWQSVDHGAVITSARMHSSTLRTRCRLRCRPRGKCPRGCRKRPKSTKNKEGEWSTTRPLEQPL